MRVVDANVLLYAVNADARHHTASHAWLERALGGADTVGLSWMALLAFARLATKPEIFPSPLSPSAAMEQIQTWIDAPSAHVLHPGERHAAILGDLLEGVGTAGNLVNDAHLAAIAIEHRASVVSYDNDFSRFPGVRWHRPDALLA